MGRKTWWQKALEKKEQEEAQKLKSSLVYQSEKRKRIEEALQKEKINGHSHSSNAKRT